MYKSMSRFDLLGPPAACLIMGAAASLTPPESGALSAAGCVFVISTIWQGIALGNANYKDTKSEPVIFHSYYSPFDDTIMPFLVSGFVSAVSVGGAYYTAYKADSFLKETFNANRTEQVMDMRHGNDFPANTIRFEDAQRYSDALKLG